MTPLGAPKTRMEGHPAYRQRAPDVPTICELGWKPKEPLQLIAMFCELAHFTHDRLARKKKKNSSDERASVWAERQCRTGRVIDVSPMFNFQELLYSRGWKVLRGFFLMALCRLSIRFILESSELKSQSFSNVSDTTTAILICTAQFGLKNATVL